MAIKRQTGGTQPGIKWGPFTTRIPGVHSRFSLPELIQGGLLTTATGGVVAALTMKYFNVPLRSGLGSGDYLQWAQPILMSHRCAFFRVPALSP